MKNINLNTILILLLGLFFIFKGCGNSDKEEWKKYLEQQNEVTYEKFDNLQIAISRLKLEIIQKDTTINIYRNYYYEITKDIDSVTSTYALRDSLRNKLKQLGSPRFN